MSKAFLILGKHGDLLSVAPIFWKQFKLTGQKTNVIVSRKYADTLSCMDYVNPVVLDIGFGDLESAIKHAKRNFNEVVIPQTYGATVGIQHKLPSFQLDQYQRAGELHSWDKLPLIIKRPNNAKDIVERFLGNRPAILVADHSESSPAPFADRLCALLEREFGKTHAVVRLSTIRLEKFCDCIALHDAAKAVVVTETAHLHLSKATTTPVFAFATNIPSRWHGSAWSKCFKFYARYYQYERVEQELVEEMRKVL